MIGTAPFGLSKGRLRFWLLIFFCALLIPTVVLIVQAYSQVKWGAFHQHRLQAEELALRVDARMRQIANKEELRTFTDYSFLVVTGDQATNILQRSPLSNLPVDTDFPGLIGYFQVDSSGLLSTPFLPLNESNLERHGIPAREKRVRVELQARLRGILSENRLVQSTPAKRAGELATASREYGFRERQRPEPSSVLESTITPSAALGGASSDSDLSFKREADSRSAQAAFDELKKPAMAGGRKQRSKFARAFGRVEDLKLDDSLQEKMADRIEQKQARADIAAAPQVARKQKSRKIRKEQNLIAEAEAPFEQRSSSLRPAQAPARIRTFESEVDSFEFSLLDSGHFVLYRKVWRDNQRYIQGMLIEQEAFLSGVIESAFRETNLSDMSNLVVAYEGNVATAYAGRSDSRYLSRAEDLQGSLLYKTKLSSPLDGLELIFSINKLPAGAAGTVIGWVTFILLLILISGFYLIYRLGVRQIDLSRQQQDFVSAVSHELKTPLTSIRMYGEMLLEGWASEEKKRTYYEYIHAESERLSRLITNVLQLARMNRNELQVQLAPHTVNELMDGIKSKISTQITRAGFSLELECDAEISSTQIQVDADSFSQIIINLVDNAIKFSSKAERKSVVIGCKSQLPNAVVFSVRDYGPGIEKTQMKKIFKLFYRSENELTRETIGTGIGLALVQQLVEANNGSIDLVNREPGAEFSISFRI